MFRPFSRCVFKPLLLLVCAPGAHAEDPGAARKHLLDYFLAVSGEQRVGALKALEARRDLGPAAFRRLLAETPRVPPFAAGTTKIETDPAGSGGVRVPLVLHVPSGYDPSRLWPLLVHLGATGEDPEAAVASRAAVADRDGWIVASPLWPESLAKSGWDSAPGHRAIPGDCVAAVRKRLRVDPDRVCLSGASLGAHAAWEAALLEPDRWAALWTRGGGPRLFGLAYAENLSRLPVRAVAGENDQPLLLGNLRRAADVLRGGAFDLRIVPGAGHSGFPEDEADGWAWLRDRRRALPDRFAYLTHSLDRPRGAWLEALALAPGVLDPSQRGPRVEIPADGPAPSEDVMRNKYVEGASRALARMAGWIRSGNRIEIETRHVGEIAVLLSDERIEPGKPVVIYRNGRKAWEGTPAWDVGWSLEQVRRSGDDGRFFFGRIVLP